MQTLLQKGDGEMREEGEEMKARRPRYCFTMTANRVKPPKLLIPRTAPKDRKAK